ncbi:MAG: AbrB/MazE/SpoVT family DNA-binding domain-containing protein [Nanoarchaeota archaeon]
MKGMKCACGKIARYVKNLRFNGFDIDGWRCESCGETYYNPTKAEKIFLLNKLKKMKYHLTLSKVKSNLILRIPKEVGEILGLHKGEKVEFGLGDNNQIVISPITSK